MKFESREASSLETSICELRCPVIDTDKTAVQSGFSLAEEDLQRHIQDSIEKGCNGAETDLHTNRVVCPLYGVSVDLNT